MNYSLPLKVLFVYHSAMSKDIGNFIINHQNTEFYCDLLRDQSFSEDLLILRDMENNFTGINPELKVPVHGSILKTAWALWKSGGSKEFYSWRN